MALPKVTKLELYLYFWDSINDPNFDKLIQYDLSQYVFNRVQKYKRKFTMNDARIEYNAEVHRRFGLLSQTDQTTVIIMNKLPEDAQYAVRKNDATT